jgi:hypothetical protein
MIVALVSSTNFQAALNQFANLEYILKANIPPEFHRYVFLPGTSPTLSGHRADSDSAGNSSSYASRLLSNDSPTFQDQSTSPTSKRYRTTQLTYAAATVHPQRIPLTVFTLTRLIDTIYDSFVRKIGDQYATTVSIGELEAKVEETSNEVKAIRDGFDNKLVIITTSVEDLTTTVHINTRISQ